MIDRIILVIWLALVAAFTGIWLTQLYFLYLEIILPIAMPLLSLAVFNKTPTAFRWTHHIVVMLGLLLVVGLSIAMVFFGGEQSAIGAYLLLFASGIGYLVFIAIFGLVYFIVRRRRRSRE